MKTDFDHNGALIPDDGFVNDYELHLQLMNDEIREGISYHPSIFRFVFGDWYAGYYIE